MTKTTIWILVIIYTLCFSSPAVQAAKKSISFSDFALYVKESTYVDKTLFIKEMLKDKGRKIVITAPRGFGKTSNLQMLKAFYQVEVDKNGNRITSMKEMVKPIKDTPNYKLFQQTNIMKCKDVMDQHFGKYPVIQLDFKYIVGFIDLNETQDFFKEVLHETILEHSYLKESGKLDEDEKEFIRKWSSEEYKAEDMGTLIPGLDKLSKYLFKHFDRARVVVMIDHYDTPILYCVTHQGVAQDAFNYVINVVQAFFSVPKDDIYVDTFLLTGVSQLEGPLVKSSEIIKRYKFLDEHRLVPFFGFVEDEVFDLLGRYAIEVENHLLENVHEHYGGYVGLDNITVHNPWAVLNYLDRQKYDHDWVKRSKIPNLQTLLKIPDIHQKLESMLKGHSTTMQLKMCLSAKDFDVLRDVVNSPKGKSPLLSSTIFYSFLFDQGFLAYDFSKILVDCKSQSYVIPNEEVKRFLWETLDE